MEKEIEITNEQAVVQHAAFMFAKAAETLLRHVLRGRGYVSLHQLPDKERKMYGELFAVNKKMHAAIESLNDEMTMQFFQHDKFTTEDALSAESMDLIRLYFHMRNTLDTREQWLEFEQNLLNIQAERGEELYLNKDWIKEFTLITKNQQENESKN